MQEKEREEWETGLREGCMRNLKMQRARRELFREEREGENGGLDRPGIARADRSLLAFKIISSPPN